MFIWWVPPRQRLDLHLRAPSTSCFLCCSATMAKRRGTTLQLSLLTEWKKRRARPALWYRFSTWKTQQVAWRRRGKIRLLYKLYKRWKTHFETEWGGSVKAIGPSLEWQLNKRMPLGKRPRLTCTYIVHKGAQSGQVVKKEVNDCLSVASGNTSTLLWYLINAACCTAIASHSDASLATSRWGCAAGWLAPTPTPLASSLRLSCLASASVLRSSSVASRAWS